jgi:hypothetical protein
MESDMNPATQEAFNQGNLRANAAYQSARRNVTINPITRLEGHGKIDIFLDDKGDVERGIQHRPARRRHAADHQPHLRRLPHGPPHGCDQMPR